MAFYRKFLKQIQRCYEHVCLLGVTFIVQDNDNQNNVSFEHPLTVLQKCGYQSEGTDGHVLSSQFILSLNPLQAAKTSSSPCKPKHVSAILPGGHSLFFWFFFFFFLQRSTVVTVQSIFLFICSFLRESKDFCREWICFLFFHFSCVQSHLLTYIIESDDMK